MDKKEARKILGVTKETSRNDIERKFSILLKKHKLAMASMDQDEQGDNEAEQIREQAQIDAAEQERLRDEEKRSFDRIVEAYNVLMGYEVKIKEEPPSKAAPLLKKAGIDEKKARNFLYYYKFHILGAIALIIFLAFTIRSCVNRVDPDFRVALIGNIYLADSEILKTQIQENIPEIIEPEIDNAYLSGNPQDEMAYAQEMKALVLATAGNVDLFITDERNYEKYAEQGLFMSLDEIAPELGVDVSSLEDYVLSVKGSDDDEAVEEPEHLYGIKITGSKALEDSGVLGEEMIASIHVNCKQVDKAVKVIEFLIK